MMMATTNSDRRPVDTLSSLDTAPEMESHTSIIRDPLQFSELFPLSLYTNRDLLPHPDVVGGAPLYDVASQPHIGRDAHLESYDRMPIEAFGKSVLAKLGW